MSIIDQIREGDLVEAVNGETVIRGRVGSQLYESRYIGKTGWRVGAFGSGWTLTVIEKAAPPPPTEPGHYERANRTVVTLLHTPREWVDAGDRRYLTNAEVGALGPLTRLEPVPDTVKRVADWLYTKGLPVTGDEMQKHFGVTS